MSLLILVSSRPVDLTPDNVTRLSLSQSVHLTLDSVTRLLILVSSRPDAVSFLYCSLRVAISSQISITIFNVLNNQHQLQGPRDEDNWW